MSSCDLKLFSGCRGGTLSVDLKEALGWIRDWTMSTSISKNETDFIIHTPYGLAHPYMIKHLKHDRERFPPGVNINSTDNKVA